MKKIGIVLLAGGSGKRMESKLVKQFIPINGKAILQHTLDLFLSWKKDIQIVLVLPKDQIEYWKSISSIEERKKYLICEGGKERFHSVKNGLKALSGIDQVMIHDGVRPLVDHDTLDRCIISLSEYDGCIPVLKPNESVRMLSDSTSKHLDRNKIRLVQTPQCFDYNKIKRAYETDFQEFFTDDASVYEFAGNEIHLIDGNRENIKITRPEDIELAKIYFQAND